MTRARLGLLASTALTLLVVVLDRRSIVGALIVLCFLSFAPGFALSRLIRFPADAVAALVITIGVSFSIDVVVTEAMVYARVWNPARGVIVLCLLVVGVVVAQYLSGRAHEQPRAKAADERRNP